MLLTEEERQGLINVFESVGYRKAIGDFRKMLTKHKSNFIVIDSTAADKENDVILQHDFAELFKKLDKLEEGL